MDIATIKALHAKHGRNMALIVNHSGGKDSHRMLGYLVEHFPEITKYVVQADTGFEQVAPISAEDFARQNVARYGLKLYMVKTPNKTYLSMVEKRRKFPDMIRRQCTSDLKRGPVEVFMRNTGRAKFHSPVREKVLINCLGIRAAESPKRSAMTPWKLDEKLSIAGRKVWNWMPIFQETLRDVLEWHWRVGHPLHPVYVPEYHADGTQGGYMRRLSCRLCIFATEHDIKMVAKHDPEAFYAVANLEQRINFTMRPDRKTLFQIVGQDTDDGQQYGSEEELPEIPCY
jgi:DNA sulfur modification protein DndC